ncbi:pilus assembly protein N-terminal domain-containing protein [Dongia deserti]|uniref:pilus assembly protein N-terminal domain-containing protein n=1 Tax=Dongia deserti TaxID=2268030 RepID=UPI000E659D47|nr:pilus assembly protein N-terminal domain-containing protein [Dongia deserti]
MSKLHGIAAILVVGALWGASTTFAETPPAATSPEVPAPIVDKLPLAGSPGVPGPNAIMLTPVDTNGNPVASGENRLVPAPKAAQKPATSSPVPANTKVDSATAAASAAASALATQTNRQLKPIKKVIGIVNNPGAEDATLDAEAELLADMPEFRSPLTSLPANQVAANVPLDAYEFDPTKGASAPVKRVQIPVEPLPATPAVGADHFELPLNKTRPIELDRAVRDVIIGNPEVADVVVRAPGQIYLIGRSVGETNVFLVDARGNLVRKLEVVVNPDGSAVEAAIRQLLPKERINVRGVGDSVVLSGVASSDGAAAQAQQIARRFVPNDDNIINMITVGSEQQVLIRVKVAEVQKTALKQLGSLFDLAAQDLGPFALDFLSTAGLTSAIGTLAFNGDNVDATFEALESQGMLRTLAQPNLLAISGEPASMLAGGEYPVVAVSDDGDSATVSVEYKPFGVSLAFLPVVIAPGRIWLKVSTEVSALSTANSVTLPFGDDDFTILGLQTRRANSTIELPSGGGIMIAGLLQDDIQSTITGVPGLMDIPILGALFRSTDFQRNETELVILVNVMLAKPVDPDLLAAPTDGLSPSHDLDRYFLGNLQSLYVKRPPEGSQPSEGPKGPIGYIIN